MINAPSVSLVEREHAKGLHDFDPETGSQFKPVSCRDCWPNGAPPVVITATSYTPPAESAKVKPKPKPGLLGGFVHGLHEYWLGISALVDAAPPADVLADCENCHDTGFVRRNLPLGHPDFGMAVACPECGRRREIARQVARLPEKFQPWTFDTFETTSAGQAMLRELAAAWLEETAPRWMFLWGLAGRGKTRTAVGILHEWWRMGRAGEFVVSHELLKAIQETYDPENPQHESGVLRPYEDVALLVLDDLGTENATPWATKKLFNLVGHRYDRELRTIVTSNHNFQELTRMHGHERLPSRIREMTTERYVIDVSKLENMRTRT